MQVIRRFTNRSLLTKFGLTSLLVVGLIGIVLGRMLQESVERQALDRAIAEAQVVSRLSLQNEIGPSELNAGLSSERVRAVQLDIRAKFARIDVVDVVLWNRDQVVAFATDTALVGGEGAATPELDRAFDGEALARIVDVSALDTQDRQLTRHGTVVQVYTPVQFGSVTGGEVSGVLRTSVPYGPVADTIAAETRRLYLALVGALVLLYAVLFRLVAEASAELRRRADENEHQARHDALTGLPNRSYFSADLDTRLAAGDAAPCAVAVIDLDRFKEVNDTLGHHHGDLLLIEVGRRLTAALRPGDLAARLGGDEFALVLGAVATVGDAAGIAERLLHALAPPYEIEDVVLYIGTSLGLALVPDHGTTPTVVMQRADMAMYDAKRSGGGWAVYDEGRREPAAHALV
ncbi:MAG: GGDEF domain-containing protein [Actinomycetota bacterium]